MPRASHAPDGAIDWPAAEQEAERWLRRYVQFKTENGQPDGAERMAAEWLAELLRAEGVKHEIVESAPGRASVVAHSDVGDPASAITLLSHSDVVPAVPGEWDVDPFAAEDRDGYLYGRGVLDLKGLGIVQLMTLVLLQRQGLPLKRQVRLLITADEEAGGILGAEWLLRVRPDLIATSLVLGEGAYSLIGMLPQGRGLHAIAVAEKGYLELELAAAGRAVHSSMPGPDDAPARLIRALARISARGPEVRVTPPVRELCAVLAEAATGLHRYVLRHPWLIERIGPRALHLNPLLSYMLTDVSAVTVLRSGYKSNVVPGEAEAVLSLRLLPGSDPDAVTTRIRAAIADPQVTMTRRVYKPSTSSPLGTADYRDIVSAAARQGATAPILSPGASDARFWRSAGVPAYGWVPFLIPAPDLHGVHGANERLSLATFREGLRNYYEVVARLASQPPGRWTGD